VSAGRLVGVGVGPGDPGHLTLKALDALRSADRVFLPETESSRGDLGRAERVIAPHVPAERIERLAFSMRDSGERGDRWDAAGRAIAAVVAAGGTAAFATIGDPNVYSTFSYVAHTVVRLVPGVEVATIPGITAMQDLAARSGTVLAEGRESVTLVPYTAGGETLREALRTDGTVVVYKGGRQLPELLDAVRAAGRLSDAIYGADVGMPGERVGRAGDLDNGAAPYMSTIIVPAPRAGRRGEKL
jgi:precorrin-2/cobalt-factor-2 C20-methyltransferase